jgi:hypothetical protein
MTSDRCRINAVTSNVMSPRYCVITSMCDMIAAWNEFFVYRGRLTGDRGFLFGGRHDPAASRRCLANDRRCLVKNRPYLTKNRRHPRTIGRNSPNDWCDLMDCRSHLANVRISDLARP